MAEARKKRRVVFLCILTGVIAYAGVKLLAPIPPLQDGDLVFQTSTAPESLAISAATGSLLSHMGVVEKTPQGDKVIEAGNVVRETPFALWVSRGFLHRLAIYRYRNLSDWQANNIVADAIRYDGTPYDIFFSFKSAGMYCSKLPYLAFTQAGVPLGKLQHFSDLHMDNFLVRELIEKRRHAFPDCKDKDFQGCYDYLMHQPVITPAALSRDAHLEKIYSNYVLF